MCRALVLTISHLQVCEIVDDLESRCKGPLDVAVKRFLNMGVSKVFQEKVLGITVRVAVTLLERYRKHEQCILLLVAVIQNIFEQRTAA